jgi:uncharacterized protein YggU (UPF0235/DUF167 family)
VVADAKKEKVTQINENHFEMYVREPAKQNQANKRVAVLLCEQFPKANRIKIVNGHHSPSKLFSIN